MSRRQVLALATALTLACAYTSCSDEGPGGLGEGIDGGAIDGEPADSEPSDGVAAGDGAETFAESCRGVADGTPCDDGSPCTLDDRCEAGGCIGGVNNPCDEEGPCRIGTCGPRDGCVYEDAEDTTPCAVACFEVATCQAGVCQAEPGTEVSCPSPDADRTCVDELRCDSATGACTREIFALEGSTCDSDGTYCTLEACDGRGECVDSGAVKDCSPQSAVDPCWTYRCQAVTGACVPEVFLEGGGCDDGNPCTASDRCRVSPTDPKDKACVGELLPLDDGNPCTDDGCVDGAVFHTPLDGITCDTGDPCDPQGLCAAGTCEFTPCECFDDDDCVADDLCAGTLACSPAGACELVPGTAVVCEDSGLPCRQTVCVPASGECALADRADDSVCDDGVACTAGDVCTAGTCAGVAYGCDDSNPCTDDVCLGDGTCDHAANAATCDDGDPCTAGDVCADSACAGAAYGCDDSNPCTDDVCLGDGSCTHPVNTSPCDDGDACTAADVCADGACAGASYGCDDSNPCTDDVCLGDGSCTHPVNTSPCDDGDACTAADVCADGACAGAAYGCDDANPCTDDTCLGDGTCAYPSNEAPCDDGDLCTAGDVCADGACAGGAYGCDDANPCTDDACVGDGTCTSAPNAAACDDGDLCTADDVCAAGTCAGAAYACDDGDVCTDDVCVGDGTCAHPHNTAACDDADACTAGDVCADGACGGAAYACDDGDPCTDDVCDGAGGCTHPPRLAGCDDRDPCTHDDGCSDGACAGTPYTCDDGEPCTTDVCAGDGTCVFTPTADACDDGQACTRDDSCATGTCAGTAYACDDGNACTDDSCLGDGTCAFTANSAPCDDGEACTFEDVCAASACAGTAYVCDDGDDCTTNECLGDGTCTSVPVRPPITRVWIGGDGAWEVDANWSPPGVPCGADIAVINQDGATVTTAGPIAYLELRVGGTVPSLLLLDHGTTRPGETLIADFGTIVQGGGVPVFGAFEITTDGVLTHGSDGAVDIVVKGDALIDGAIDADTLGSDPAGRADRSGGSHGGLGGYSWVSDGPPRTAIHGSLITPRDSGSPGTAAWGQGVGSGRVAVRVDGTLTVKGRIHADGEDAPTEHKAGGSGGSVHVIATALGGGGAITARGGDAIQFGGGGGGGRVAIESDVTGFSGTVDVGGGSAGGSGGPGTAGTWALNMQDAVRFAFTTSAPTVRVTDTSAPFTVELQDADGVPVRVGGTPLVVELFSTSATASFSASAGFATTVDQVVIPVGQSAATFWYQDTTVGLPTVTAGGAIAGGVAPATHVVTMTNGPTVSLAISTEPRTAPVDTATAPLTVERRDVYGNPVPDGDLTVALASSSATGRFDGDAAGPFDGSVTSILIPDGQTTVDVFYLDPTPGRPVVTISDAGGVATGDTQRVLVVDGPDLKIWVGDDGAWEDAANWDPPGAPTATTTAVVNRRGVDVTTAGPVAFRSLQVGGTVTCGVTLSGATGSRLLVADGGTIIQAGGAALALDTLEIEGDGTLTHAAGAAEGVTVVTTGDVLVDGAVDATARGSDGAGRADRSGGSHGGLGGFSWVSDGPPGTAIHGDILRPADHGSEGTAAWGSEPGGGRVRLDVGGALTLNGTVRVDGRDAPTEHKAGGSGGSVWIDAASVAGGGVISARGGHATQFGGGGGGGRVALDSPATAFAGSVSVDGGNAGGSGGPGQAGTYALDMAHAVRFVVTTPPQSLTVGKASEVFRVELQDAGGAPVTVQGRPLVVQLATTSPTGVFSASAGFASTTDRVVIPLGLSSVEFWYQDQTVGDHDLTAGGRITVGIEPATQVVRVASDQVDHILYVSQPWTVPVDAASPGLVLERRDEFGNPVTVGALAVDLASSSGTGRFDQVAAGAFDGSITSVTFVDGSATATFFYRDSTAGVHVLTVSDPLGAVASVDQEILVVTGPDLKIWIGPDGGDWHDAGGWDPPGVPTGTSTVYVNRLDTAVGSSASIAFAFLQVGGTVPTVLTVTGGGGGPVVVARDGTLIQDTPAVMSIASLGVATGGVLTHRAGSTVGVNLDVAGDATVDGLVDATALGSDPAGRSDRSGGSHAGRGGFSWVAEDAPTTAVHGSLLAPADLGSPGTAAWGEEPGAGRVRLNVGGELRLDGTVRVDGKDAPTEHKAGGSGGSVHLSAGTWSGSGAISARGGHAIQFGGGGGGGRVAVDAGSVTWAGTVSVVGGTAGGSGGPGEQGTWALGMKAATHFAITSPPQSFVVTDTSAPYRVELRDAADAPVLVAGLDLVVELATDSPAGSFSATAGFAVEVDRVRIPVGQSGVDFWYRDRKAGVHTVTAGGPVAGGVTPGTQDVTMIEGVTAKLVLVTPTVNAVISEPSDPIVVERRDTYDNPTRTGAQPVDLATTAASGRFDTEPAGPFDGSVTSTSIPDGLEATTFYYWDTVIGTPLISVSDDPSGLLGDSVEVNVVPVPP